MINNHIQLSKKMATTSWRKRFANILLGGSSSKKISTSRDTNFPGTAHINIHVFKATGGFVLEYTNIDNDIGEVMRPSLHLIRDDEDLGQAISHIITVEMLRQT